LCPPSPAKAGHICRSSIEPARLAGNLWPHCVRISGCREAVAVRRGVAGEDGQVVSEHETTGGTAGEPSRRDFLYLTTGMAGVVGAAAVAWPFIDQMRPDASTLALASIEVDISSLT